MKTQEMSLVKGPAVKEIMQGAENDPIESRFKVKERRERTHHSLSASSTARTIRWPSRDPSQRFCRQGGHDGGNQSETDNILKGLGVTTHKETPGLGGEAKAEPAFAAQFKGKIH